jgi:hypothetical protein
VDSCARIDAMYIDQSDRNNKNDQVVFTVPCHSQPDSNRAARILPL